MDINLKLQFVHALSRFKKTGLGALPNVQDVNMTELQVLAGISQNLFGVDHVDLTEIQRYTFVTKAAISKMFASLERRGYIIRETDKNNRRRITVALTPSGMEVLKQAMSQADQTIGEIISRLGEGNARTLISLLEQASDIRDELAQEAALDSKTIQ